MRSEMYPSEKINVGGESVEREVSTGGEMPASLAAAITGNGGEDAAKAKFLMSMLLLC